LENYWKNKKDAVVNRVFKLFIHKTTSAMGSVPSLQRVLGIYLMGDGAISAVRLWRSFPTVGSDGGINPFVRACLNIAGDGVNGFGDIVPNGTIGIKDIHRLCLLCVAIP
jgi:fructose 1,6-bisphosphatase